MAVVRAAVHSIMMPNAREAVTLVELLEVTGPFEQAAASPEVRAWMAQFPGAVTQYEHHVAGFVRPTPG